MAFEALKMLQEKCGVAPDGAFGPNTAKAITAHFELSPERGAHLLGQVVHESGTFRYTRENLNYSVEAMMKVWPNRFPTEESAEPFARNPKAIRELNDLVPNASLALKRLANNEDILTHLQTFNNNIQEEEPKAFFGLF